MGGRCSCYTNLLTIVKYQTGNTVHGIDAVVGSLTLLNSPEPIRNAALVAQKQHSTLLLCCLLIVLFFSDFIPIGYAPTHHGKSVRILDISPGSALADMRGERTLFLIIAGLKVKVVAVSERGIIFAWRKKRRGTCVML
jgi:hypothetical protein